MQKYHSTPESVKKPSVIRRKYIRDDPASDQVTPNATVAPTQAAQWPLTTGSRCFTPDQLGILKHQIFAFKSLSKNLDIPQATQQALFASQQKRRPPPVIN
jgi:ATP-dependent helicase STH1/SNF2